MPPSTHRNKRSRDNRSPKRVTTAEVEAHPADSVPKVPFKARRRVTTAPLSLAADYRPPGQDKPGYNSHSAHIQKMWKLNYAVTPDQLDLLHKRFPGLRFYSESYGCHDHPIAHVSMQIVWSNVLNLLGPGDKAVDICGNPAVNERHLKDKSKMTNPPTIDTFCQVLCAKDSIRAVTRWGPRTKDGVARWTEMSLYDMYRFASSNAPEVADHNKLMKSYNKFLMNHVLYYYKMSEINQLLNMNKDSVLYATIHRLPGMDGEINCGEQKYVKDGKGRVRMHNVETGEFYEHRDPQEWFNQYAYADQNGAFAWTIDKGCDDTYIITATSCIPKLVEEENWLDGKKYTESSNEPGEIAITQGAPIVHLQQHEVVVLRPSDLVAGLTGQSRNVTITHPELYTSLKLYMVNKTRNERALNDLTAYAKRMCGFGAILGATTKTDITSTALAEHVAAAFAVGHALETSLYRMVQPQFASVAARGTVMKRVCRIALNTIVISRSSDPLHHTVKILDDLLAG